MKSKTIKKVLRKKFNDFCKSIKDKDVRNLVLKNSIITGGSIASMFLREPVNDFDIYFKNAETVKAVAEYYINDFINSNSKFNITLTETTDDIDGIPRYKIKVHSDGIAAEEEFEYGEGPDVAENPDMYPDINGNMTNPVPCEDISEFDCNEATNDNEDETKDIEPPSKYRPVYLSSNAITLSDKIQLIIRFYGSAEEIHKNYDFVHCTCYWESDTGKLTLPSEALAALLSKELIYRGSRYPLASIIRSRKFFQRGFTINAGQYLKMCIQLNSLDLTKLSVLEDQLTGVDAYYFINLLHAIPEKSIIDGSVDSEYIITLVDRFF
jgi:hypothetical protein